LGACRITHIIQTIIEFDDNQGASKELLLAKLLRSRYILKLDCPLLVVNPSPPVEEEVAAWILNQNAHKA